ncbi:MAG: hypothetical protein WCX82_01075 [archaeon]|jgi:hypothetical protein
MRKDILKKEINTFNKKKKELLQSKENEFVLIKSTTVIGTYKSQKDAVVTGIKKFGNAPFLVKRISEEEDRPSFAFGLI